MPTIAAASVLEAQVVAAILRHPKMDERTDAVAVMHVERLVRAAIVAAVVRPVLARFGMDHGILFISGQSRASNKSKT